MTTLGVEEEYLLVDPATGLPMAETERVRALARTRRALDAEDVQPELLQAQVEVATPVCRGLDEVGGHLLRLRHELAEAAEAVGCRLIASGTAPVSGKHAVPVTDKPRYQAIRAGARRLADVQLINGMHVHVAVPDREAGVQVVNRLRPWLPLLVALSGNSPMWEGHDTGYASWRTVHFSRWPVEGPPPFFGDLEEHERRIEALLAAGVIRDRGQIYWQARVSDRYPTVEVRTSDVQLRVDDAVMLAGIVRALVVTLLEEHREGLPYPRTDPELLRAAVWLAARYGLEREVVAPTGQAAVIRRTDSARAIEVLLDHVGPVLDRHGDTAQVLALLDRQRREGTGADRQRGAFAEGGLPRLLELLADDTTAS